MLFNPLDYTTIFLSYDEPNCEENYQHLLSLNPHALRVHGVKGSDTAHKQVAKLSKSKNVIIVDADSVVKQDFFSTTFELPEQYNPETSVLSFSAYNIINGNCYGNGGVKVWPVSLLESMRTHENGDSDSIDFDFSNYIELNNVASDTHVNGSPLQAWRAGFREGIKLTIDNKIDWRNYDRLWRWMHLGLDVTNGVYAIHGARSAFYLLRLNKLEYPSGVKDFDFLNKMFELSNLNEQTALAESNQLGLTIRLLLDKHTRNVLWEKESKEYKETVKPILRVPDDKPYDIIHINSRKGKLHKLYKGAAKRATTDYFWIVDGDAPDFNFDYVVPFYEQPKVRVWNNVKLLPRMNVLRMNENAKDINKGICEDVDRFQ